MDSTNVSNQIEFDHNYNHILKKLEEIDCTLPTINKKFSYGTSGFRYHESVLEKVRHYNIIL